MRNVLIPVIAGLALTGLAIAQESTPRTEKAPKAEIRVRTRVMGAGGFLGVQLQEVTGENMGSLGMSDQYGALILETVKDSPAEKAGLQKNDVIVSWNGTRVESAAQLTRLVGETPAGRTVRIGYIRSGARSEMEVKLDQRKGMHGFMMNCDTMLMNKELRRCIPHFDREHMEKMQKELMQGLPNLTEEQIEKMQKEMMESSPYFNKEHLEKMQKEFGGEFFFMDNSTRTGASLQSMTPQLAQYFGLSDRTGALVGSVRESSAAAAAGLQAGDVVVAIDGEKVESPLDASRIFSGKEGEVEVTVIRDKAERTLRIKLEGPAMNHMDPSRIYEQFGNFDFKNLEQPFMIFKRFNGELGPQEEGEIEIEIDPSEQSDGDAELGEIRSRRQMFHFAVPPATPIPPVPAEPPATTQSLDL